MLPTHMGTLGVSAQVELCTSTQARVGTFLKHAVCLLRANTYGACVNTSFMPKSWWLHAWGGEGVYAHEGLIMKVGLVGTLSGTLLYCCSKSKVLDDHRGAG